VPGSPVESCSLCQTGLWPALVFLPKLWMWSLLVLTLLFLFACFLCFFFLLCSAGLSIQPEHRSTHSVVTDLQKAYFCLYLARNIYSILRCRVVKSSHGINMRSALPQLVNVAILVGKRVILIKTHTGLLPALLFLNSHPFQRSTFVPGRSCRRDLQSPLSLPSSFLLRSL